MLQSSELQDLLRLLLQRQCQLSIALQQHYCSEHPMHFNAHSSKQFDRLASSAGKHTEKL
jgi:hypothetical protein